MKRIRCLATLAAALLITLRAGAVTAAQDDDQAALIARILAAAARADTMTSFVETFTTAQVQSTSVVIPDILEQTNYSNTLREGTAAIIRGQTPNGIMTATITFDSDDGMDDPVAFIMQAEARYVDGVLYVSASYSEATDTAPALPEGWVAVDDPLSFFEFDPIDLDHLLDLLDLEGDDEEADAARSPLEMVNVLVDMASSITLEETELEDGRPVDLITFVFGWDALETLMAEQSESFDPTDPVVAAIAGLFAEADDLMTMAIALDGDDMPVGIFLDFAFEAADVDLANIDNSAPAGSTLALSLTQSEHRVVSQINETFEPVAAPAQ